MDPILEKVFEWAFAYVENETCIPELPSNHPESISYEKAKKLLEVLKCMP